MSSESGAYQVVARRFRPQEFGEVVGQEAILSTLRRALASGRIPHAFLFAGSRGVGKTTTARILARALNCAQGPTPDPCGTCDSCVAVLAGRNPDVIEIDAASHNLVDDVRQLRERVGIVSTGSRYKVYILDEVHMLTRSAFNAFLKTLEEPPPRVVFVLATTEMHKVPDTIRSRCQVLLFERVGAGDIVRRLGDIAAREGVALPPEVLEDIANSCAGGMRDAESALERVLPVAKAAGEAFDLEAYRRLAHRVGHDQVLAVAQALVAAEAGPALRFVAELFDRGLDEREALGALLALLRDALLMVVDGPDTDLVAATGDARQALGELATAAGVERLDAMIQAGLIGRERMRRLEDRRLVMETCMVRMARAGDMARLGDLVEAVRGGALTAAAGAGRGPGTAPSAPPQLGARGIHAQLLQRLQEQKPLLVRTVEACELAGPDGDGRVVLRLKSGARLHRDRLASDDLKATLRQILTELHGEPVTLVVEAGGAATRPPPTSTDGPPGGADQRAPAARRAPGPMVERAAKRFDGRIIDLDDESPV